MRRKEKTRKYQPHSLHAEILVGDIPSTSPKSLISFAAIQNAATGQNMLKKNFIRTYKEIETYTLMEVASFSWTVFSVFSGSIIGFVLEHECKEMGDRKSLVLTHPVFQQHSITQLSV